MEKNKYKNNSLHIITICCILILLLVIGLLGTYFYYNNLAKILKGTDKKAVSADEFKAYIETKGFIILPIDKTNLSKDLKNISKNEYITVKNDKENFQINFFEFEDEEDTMYYFYQAIIANKYNYNGTYTKEIEKTLNYTKYTAKINDTYIVTSRIKSTLIWGTIDVDHKQDLDKIITDLGY